MSSNKKVCLIILDGWGKGKKDNGDAIFAANTPFTDSLSERYAHAELRTDGENVGLPEGQMGNSEVGHMNLGAGRIVYQDLVRINVAIREKTLERNPVLLKAFHYARENNSTIHFMGLVSDGGVHSHINHLKALCDFAAHEKAKQVFIHAFAYDLLVHGKGNVFASASDAIHASYAKDVTDEFIEPAVITGSNGEPLAVIRENDVVICFNFRTDRCREITIALTQKVFPELAMKPVPVHYVTMTNYDDTFENVNVVYDKDNLKMTLGEVLSQNGRTQIRIAETEKYPHVSFFFSGGREEEFEGERRIMVPSPKVATYDLQPEMSARKITEAIVLEMKRDPADFICLNFANPDMVGHTGVFEAIVKAVETTDTCLREVVEAGSGVGYSFIIIADHGNAEYAINEDGTPNTAHTINPVPIWLLDKDVKAIRNGILAEIAPTVLKILGISKPEEMVNEALF